MLKYILISFLIITNVYAYTCEEMGYTQTIEDCPDHGLRCPAEPEKMFCCDPCGNRGGYKYNKNNCSPDNGLQLAGTECKGKWTECRQCTSEYKYNKDNCRTPKILAGVQCGNSYTQCVYPTGIGCIPTVGYIYYSDGSCHADYDDTKTPIGIIVDAARKTIAALDEPKLQWTNASGTNVPDLPNKDNIDNALLDFEGQSNTDKIVAFAILTGQEYKAAQYCANKTDGNKKWYLPALGELNALYIKVDEIQTSLASIPEATQSILSEYYWSSTEIINKGYAWALRLSDGYTTTLGKRSTFATRCFAKF